MGSEKSGPAKRIDAEGRPWRLRNVPVCFWILPDHVPRNKRRELSNGFQWWSMVTISLAMPLGAHAAFVFVGAHTVIGHGRMLRISVVFFLIMCLSVVWMYFTTRRQVALQLRPMLGECPCCGQWLVGTPRADIDGREGEFRRCPECGHLWAWPLEGQLKEVGDA